MDAIGEDFNKSPAARATGYMGKNSDVVWMQRLSQRAAVASVSDSGSGHSDNIESTSGERRAVATGISGSTYHCDSSPIGIPDHVDAYELPLKHVADSLFQTYLDTVHPTFPILGKANFVTQFNVFSNSPGVNTGDNWRAILNLIFGIAAKYAHLVQADWRGDERDHLIYFTRARMLGFNGDTILAHPDLQQIQISGLMAFYLAATGQINRAWTCSGIAVRHAATLGLNLRNEDPGITDLSREVRYQVWWALCSTERMLAVMTGRPTSFLDTDCSTPLPLPVEEGDSTTDLPGGGVGNETMQSLRRYSSLESKESEPSASTTESSPVTPGTAATLPHRPSRDPDAIVPPSDALSFLHSTKLTILTNLVLNRLYRANTSERSWAEVQESIRRLDAKLERWRQSLPPVFDPSKRQREQQFMRQRLCLGFSYYSTRIIINRPCLCRVDRRIPHESGKAKDFNRTAAARCVHAARGVIDMLPAEPNAAGLYRVCPWWCLVHHLVQATTILMLELSFRADHTPNEAEELFDAAKKAIRWLRSMWEDNPSARRAWEMCDDLLRKVAPKIGKDASDFDDRPGTDQDIPPRDRPFDLGASDYATQPTDPTYFGSGHNSRRHAQMYSAYDEFLAPLTSTQISSGYVPMHQPETIFSGAPGDLGGPLHDSEPRWDADGHQQM